MPTAKYTLAQKRAYAKRKAAERARGSTRPVNTWTGRGAYKGPYKGFSQDLGRFIGTAIGKRFGAGAPLGAVGGYLGSKFSNLTGFGAYHVSKNTLLAPQNARIRNVGPHGDQVIIRHREYLTDVTGSVAFTKQLELDLNPGLSAFPWLSGVANNYQIWSPSGIIFEYVPMSGAAISGSSAALGTVIMATQHDSLEREFEDKQEMLNHNFAVSVAPCSGAILPIECDPRFIQASRLYVRDSDPPDQADKRLSDLGRVTIATSDFPSDDTLAGSLYVTYEIALSLPKLTHSLGELVKTAHYQLNNADAMNPYGTTQTKTHDSIGLSFPSSSQMDLPSNNMNGRWLVAFSWIGTSTADVGVPDITANNIQSIQMFDGNTTSFVRTTLSGGNAATRCIGYYAFKIVDPSKPSWIDLSTFGTLPASVTSADVMITQIDDDHRPTVETASVETRLSELELSRQAARAGPPPCVTDRVPSTPRSRPGVSP